MRNIASVLDGEIVLPSSRMWWLRAFTSLRRENARKPFDGVLTGIDVSGLIVGLLTTWWLRVPWIAVCEDHPFQARYDHGGSLRAFIRSFHTCFLIFALKFPKRLIYFIHPDVLDFLAVKDSIKVSLHNSADLESLNPIWNKGASNAEPATVAYVGVVNESKGGIYMLEVFAKVRAARPDAKLLFIGRVEDGFKSEFESAITRLGIKESVELTGQLDPDEAYHQVARAAVCLHAYTPVPWLYHNQPLKVLEYMALGRVTVSVDSPGVHDLMREGIEGFFTPHGDTDAMSERVIQILGDRELRERMQKAARKRAEELSWEKTEGQLFAVLEECLAKTPVS